MDLIRRLLMAFTYTIRKDGRLMKRVSVDGKIKTLYSDNVKDLERQYIEAKHLSNKGIIVDDEGITFKQWSDKWLALYKSDKEQATIDMYKTTLRLHINPCIGNMKLKNIKQIDIINILNQMEKKNITRRREWALLTIKQILQSAIDNELIYKNVAASIKIKKHKSAEKKPLSANVIDRIKKLSENDFDVFMILFMIYTGLRREEIVPLQYKDIDIDNKYITINKAVHFSKNQPIVKKTKNEDIRKVPILDILYDKLKNLKKDHKNSEYIFHNKLNNMMSETTLKRKITSVLNRLNQDYKKEQMQENEKFELTEDNKIKFTYHQLRHTYVCILHKAGVDLKEAQSFTGHKTIQVLLDVYTHLDEEDKTNAINKLNAFI